MTVTVRRITVSLPREQIKSLKNVSKMLKTPVSALVSDLIGEAVTSFEQLVVNRDVEGAWKRVDDLSKEAKLAIEAVRNVKPQ